MSDRLPPLTALRAFEAAARHMSFALAAAELNVTPAALSFQIKSLESHLGAPVFRRLNRAVELTEAGEALVPGVTEGFAALSRGWRAAQRVSDDRSLTVTAGPAFTSKWLAPRLYDFAQAHPEIELRVAASLRLMDFDRDGVDVAIRFGRTTESGLFTEPLVEEWLMPMMVPELAEAFGTVDGLAKAPLIHDDSMGFLAARVTWADWSGVAGVAMDTERGVRFSQADHALDAALSGAGVVLGRVSLATRALEQGRLVAPFQTGVLAPAQFRFLCPKGSEERPQVAAFRDWMAREILATKAFEKGRKIVSA